MKILNRLNKLKKPRSKNKNIFNSLKINNSSKHLIGIDNKGLIVVLINSIKPKGNGEYLSNIIIKHGVNCSVHLKHEKLTKKFTMIKCLSNDNSTKELFLMSLERILENIPNEVSEIKIDELTKKLVKLFEKLSNKINIDLTGFWGELFIIDYLKSTELLVEAWHSETNDLFDFFLKNLALEVKTTINSYVAQDDPQSRLKAEGLLEDTIGPFFYRVRKKDLNLSAQHEHVIKEKLSGNVANAYL